MCQFQIVSTEGFTPVPCAKTVPESDVFMPLGLALSEKQIPQITENTEKPKQGMELLESVGPRPRQARYEPGSQREQKCLLQTSFEYSQFGSHPKPFGL